MIVETFAWWLVLEGVGLIALPIALVVFRRLPGAGYAFAKPLGLLLCGYVFWLALSLHVLPNRPGSVVLVLLCLVAVDLILIKRQGTALAAALRGRLGLIVAVEVVFTLALFGGGHLRSFIPEIAGTEKPMDFMLLNAASRSAYYPPGDAWLAGFDVSYYYFGYVLQAMVAKLAAAPTAIAFNLGVVGAAALAAVAAFGLGFDLASLARRATFRAALVTGAAAAVFVVLLGNLEGAFEFAVANGYSGGLIQSLDIANIEGARQSGSCILSGLGGCIAYPDEESSFWWWWRATRISPDANSITEFPFFSFLLGDLHPHVMSIPYVLTGAALGLVLWRSPARLDLGFWRRQPLLLLLFAVFVGGLSFLNTWDLPTFGFLIVLLALARNATGTLGGPGHEATRAVVRALAATAAFTLPLLLLALLAYLPFYLGFSNQAAGLAAVTDEATKPLHSVLFWAPLVALALPLPLLRLGADRAARAPGRLAAAFVLPLLLFALWLLVIVVNDGAGAVDAAFADRGANWLTAVFFAAAFAVTALALWRALEAPAADEPALVPVLAATATAFLLILGAELFFIQDVFGSRLNTVFKLSYQAWLLLGVSGAYGLLVLVRPATSRALGGAELLRGAWVGVVVLILAAALLYPLGATLSRTDGLARSDRTLDGLAFTRDGAGDDFAALDWLRRRAGQGEILVEATGGQYSAAARVSSRSGIPTVIGWAGHEVQWGRSGDLLARRESDVDRTFTTGALAEALTILREYDVAYVFVGSLERGKYPAEGLAKFSALPVAFRSGETTVYRVPKLAAPQEASAP